MHIYVKNAATYKDTKQFLMVKLLWCVLWNYAICYFFFILRSIGCLFVGWTLIYVYDDDQSRFIRSYNSVRKRKRKRNECNYCTIMYRIVYIIKQMKFEKKNIELHYLRTKFGKLNFHVNCSSTNKRIKSLWNDRVAEII